MWTQLTQTVLGAVMEGVTLGPFLAKFHLSETTLGNLLQLDKDLKPAWNNIVVSLLEHIDHNIKS